MEAKKYDFWRDAKVKCKLCGEEYGVGSLHECIQHITGYKMINAKWWRIVDGEPERELTEDEARDVGWGIWP